MNGKAFGDTISDVAASIANSKLYGQLTKGVGGVALKEELQNTVAVNEDLVNAINTGVNSALHSAGKETVTDVLTPIQKAVLNRDNAEEIAKKAAKKLEVAGQLDMDLVKGLIGSANSQQYLDAGANPFAYAKAYFTSSSKQVNKVRKNAAIGAYAGLAVGGRYLSGGTLTQDAYGRRDIAGIPFV